MYYWFAPHYLGSNWDPERDGYGQVYVDTVSLVRNWFGLKKIACGRDSGGDWILCLLGKSEDKQKRTPADKRLVEVRVQEFLWDEGFYKNIDLIVRFRLNTKMRWHFNDKIFFDDQVIIECPIDYPVGAPWFYYGEYVRYKASPDHHTLSDGRLCILTAGKDWGKSDTIITAIIIAFNRIVQHTIEYGK